MDYRKKTENFLDSELEGKRLKRFIIVFTIVITGIILFFFLSIISPELIEPLLYPIIVLWILGGFFTIIIIYLIYPWPGYKD